MLFLFMKDYKDGEMTHIHTSTQCASLLCSLRLFDQKYSLNGNIGKYYYNKKKTAFCFNIFKMY